jgi:nicotinamide-nucleotide adenylyltransferase
VLTAAAVTGRFQPFHNGHWELLALALAEAEEVFIGITNPDPSSWVEHESSSHRHRPEANPFTYWQRQRIIQSVIDSNDLGGRCQIVPFPIDRREAWPSYIPLDAEQFVRVFSDWERDKVGILEAGGYRVRVIEGDPSTVVRATDIRRALSAGEDDAWKSLVPAGVAELIPGQVRSS